MLFRLLQERSSLPGHDDDFSSEANLPSEDTRNGDEQSKNKESSHDTESEDPLEGNDLSKELPNTEGSGEDAEGKPHSVVLYSISMP